MQSAVLQILLSLNGNKRIPHLEKEIFANRQLTTLYLSHICCVMEWLETDSSNACLAYFYATEVIKGRWPEAEDTIKSSYSFWWQYETELNL